VKALARVVNIGRPSSATREGIGRLGPVKREAIGAGTGIGTGTGTVIVTIAIPVSVPILIGPVPK